MTYFDFAPVPGYELCLLASVLVQALLIKYFVRAHRLITDVVLYSIWEVEKNVENTHATKVLIPHPVWCAGTVVSSAPPGT